MNKNFFIVILILCSVAGSFAQNTISIQTRSTASGDTGTFAIVMKNDVAVNGLNFILRYDPNIITPIWIKHLMSGPSVVGEYNAAFFGDDRISFLVYDDVGSMLSPDSATIFEVEYIVADSIHDSATTPLTFTEGMAADSNIQVMAFEYVDGAIPISPVVGVRDEPSILPRAYRLEQNYPNPCLSGRQAFNPATSFEFRLPALPYGS